MRLPSLALFAIHVPLDVSTSFKRLQAEKVAADRVLRELTPVESVSEVEALREHFQNMNMKTEVRLHPAVAYIYIPT